MDPEANLNEQRRIADRLLTGDMVGHVPDTDAVRLAELVVSLDGWLSAGGFLPRDWADSTRGEAP